MIVSPSSAAADASCASSCASSAFPLGADALRATLLPTLPAQIKKLVGDAAPLKLRLLAAKGVVVGLKPDAIVTVVLLLTQADDAEVATQAQKTLAALPTPILQGSLNADLPAAVIFALAENYTNQMAVLPPLLAMPRLPIEAVEYLAEYGGEATTELVATNQERVLAHPRILELLYMNKRSRMSTINRLVELCVRNGVTVEGLAVWNEIAAAIQGELIVAEPTEEAVPEDQFFWETDELAREIEAAESTVETYVEDADGEEELAETRKPLLQRIADMSIAEKVRTAMLGTKDERMILIREQNKVVARAAAKSPLLREADVRLVARNRSICEDVLRIVASNPEFLKSYNVKKALVENPKTPLAISARLIAHIRESDLRRLAKNKNIASAIRLAAKRHLDRRKR